jgi:hypothetical protein
LTLPNLRSAAAIAGFAGLGALAAGFLGGLPAWIRVWVGLGAVVVAPALFVSGTIDRITGPGRGFLTVVLPASLAVVLAVHAFIATVFSLAGGSYTLYATCLIWILLVVYGLVVARALRARGRLPP